MLAARGGRSEKEKDRKDRNHYKSTGLCSQRRGVGEDGVGAGALPGRSEAVGSGTNQEKHDPEVGTRRAQTPLPTPPPDTRERHGPPPHSDNPRRHSLPSPWADIPALEPPWARWPSLPGKSHKEMAPQETFTWSTQALPTPETAPTQGRNGSRGGLPRERVVS